MESWLDLVRSEERQQQRNRGPRHQSKGQVALRGIFRDQFLNGGGLRLSRCSTSRQVAAILPHRSGCKFCRLLFGIPCLPAAALDILLVDDTREAVRNRQRSRGNQHLLQGGRILPHLRGQRIRHIGNKQR